MDDRKKWRTPLVRMYLVQAKVLLCLFVLVVLPSSVFFASFQTLLKCDLGMFGPLPCSHLREQVAQCLCRSR